MKLLFIGGLGMTEILIIALVVLLFFGGKKIPELMKGLGKGVRSFKEGVNGTLDETDSDKMSDILEIEIKGKTYRPKELDSDEISNNRIVQKGLKLIKVKYQYEQED